MQSVPAKRTTNRLIRGNRTGEQKRCGSYSFCRDRSQGKQHGFPRRETSFRSGNGLDDICEYRLEIGIDAGLWFYLWDRQELIGAVGITGIPGSKGKESFFNEFVASLVELVYVKGWHGSFDNVESPTGESVLVGNECKKEIESEFFGFEVGDPLGGAQTVVEPGEGLGNGSHAIGHDGREWFFKRHDRFSLLLMMRDVVDITCCRENRRAVIIGLQKLKKLESLSLAKPSDLCLLYPLASFLQSAMFAQSAETEVDSKKKIQQINKFRWKEDSKIPSFTTLY